MSPPDYERLEKELEIFCDNGPCNECYFKITDPDRVCPVSRLRTHMEEAIKFRDEATK